MVAALAAAAAAAGAAAAAALPAAVAPESLLSKNNSNISFDRKVVKNMFVLKCNDRMSTYHTVHVNVYIFHLCFQCERATKV